MVRGRKRSVPLTANIDDPGPEYPRLDVQDVRVVGHDDGDDGHLRLDCEVDCAFLERQQVRRPRVRPRALGEDEDALLLAPHVCGRAVKGGARGGAVRAVNEDGFREGHWGGWVSFSCNEMKRCRGMVAGRGQYREWRGETY